MPETVFGGYLEIPPSEASVSEKKSPCSCLLSGEKGGEQKGGLKLLSLSMSKLRPNVDNRALKVLDHTVSPPARMMRSPPAPCELAVGMRVRGGRSSTLPLRWAPPSPPRERVFSMGPTVNRSSSSLVLTPLRPLPALVRSR